jgi:hypothetical protein
MNDNQKFLRGGVRKAQSAGRKANNTIGAMRKAPCAMRHAPSPWPPEAETWQMVMNWMLLLLVQD